MDHKAPGGKTPPAWDRNWISRLAWLGVGLVAGMVVACGVLAISAPPDTVPADAASGFRLMAEAWNTIQRHYVDRTALVPTRLTYGAIRGMVDALGDTGHSRFLTPEMVRNERGLIEGAFEGVGAELQMEHNQVVIVAPFDDSPAQRAGLRPGDIILKVNRAPVAGLALDHVVRRITGPAGTTVQLTIMTPSLARTRDVELVRRRITLHNVTWHRLPGTRVAHVRIASFSKGVSEDLEKALKEIHHERLGGLILDLRNDPGGLFDEAVHTASQFLASGDVLLERDTTGEVTPVPVRGGGVALRIPLVVLINNGTASAAEIVAGALKDGRRATLVGETTFGTGTLLKPFSLSDGSAILLASKEWLTPAGHLIWHKGISPDVAVSLSPDVSVLIPETERGMTPADLRSSADAQLLRALDLVQQRLGPQVRPPVPPPLGQQRQARAKLHDAHGAGLLPPIGVNDPVGAPTPLSPRLLSSVVDPRTRVGGRVARHASIGMGAAGGAGGRGSPSSNVAGCARDANSSRTHTPVVPRMEAVRRLQAP